MSVLFLTLALYQYDANLLVDQFSYLLPIKNQANKWYKKSVITSHSLKTVI